MPIQQSFLYAKRKLVEQFHTRAVPDACVFYLIYWIKQASDTYDQLPGTLTKPGKPDGDRKYHLKKMLNIIWKWVTRPRTDQQRQATVVFRPTVHGFETVTRVCKRDGVRGEAALEKSM
jgi:hypothetical protein